jgi:hypothetical protein
MPLTDLAFGRSIRRIGTCIVTGARKTMQQADSAANQREGQRRVYGRPFPPGVSGNPRGSLTAAERRARLDAMVANWVSELAELGIRAGTAERLLLRRAAELSQVRPHRNEDHVRTVNTISKLLAQAGFRKDRPRKRKPTMVAALGEGEADGPFGGS